MTLNDTLSNALSKINDYDNLGKKECMIQHSSKIIKKVLDILNHHNYVGKYDIVKTDKGEFLKLSLIGNINKCGVIKPRFAVKRQELEKFEKRFLPAENFGMIIISTSRGILTHYEAKKQNIGGKLIAFVY